MVKQEGGARNNCVTSPYGYFYLFYVKMGEGKAFGRKRNEPVIGHTSRGLGWVVGLC